MVEEAVARSDGLPDSQVSLALWRGILGVSIPAVCAVTGFVSALAVVMQREGQCGDYDSEMVNGLLR